MIKALVAAVIAPLLMSGCLAGAAIGATGAVVGAGVHATGAVVGAGVKATGAVVGAVTPGGSNDEEHRRRDR